MKIINVTTMVFQWQNVVLSPRSGLQPDHGVRVNPNETPQQTKTPNRGLGPYGRGIQNPNIRLVRVRSPELLHENTIVVTFTFIFVSICNIKKESK